LIGIDTNILVRYLAQDDMIQSVIAERLVGSFTQDDPGFVSQIVLVETVWILTRIHKIPRHSIVDMLKALLHSNELVFEGRETILAALSTFRNTKADFSDALIAHNNSRAGCEKTFTFDRNAANIKGMRLLD